jgi:hypothetical protein
MNRLLQIRHLLPIILLAIFNIYGWIIVALDDSISSAGEQIVSSIMILILVSLQYKKAISIERLVFLQGLLLFFWAFAEFQVCHNIYVQTFRLKIGSIKLSSPSVDLRGLLVLIVFVLVNKKYILGFLKTILEVIDGKKSVKTVFK